MITIAHSSGGARLAALARAAALSCVALSCVALSCVACQPDPSPDEPDEVSRRPDQLPPPVITPVRDAEPPPPPPDMGPDLGPPFDLLFNACIDKMKERVHAKWEEVCGDYTAAERAAPEYQMGVAAAGCIRVVCDPLSTNSRVIDSHNGIMAARSCRELLELEEALTGVAAQVNEQGGCANSSYSVRLLTPEEFSSGMYIGDDSCDELTCDVEGESVIFTHVP